MIVESLINFEIGKRVKYNPENHGFLKLGVYHKVMNREGTVGKLPCVGCLDEKGNAISKRTGQVWVLWDGDRSCRIVNYKNLRII